jgi:predicted nucleic acid-binding protein
MTSPTKERPPIIVDASVGVKWVLNENYTSHALSLFSLGCRLIAPDRFYSEVANVLWKRTLRSDPSECISEEVAREALNDLLAIRLSAVAGIELVSASLEIALEIGHPSYDCDYLALAILET